MIPPDANAAFVAAMEDVLEVYTRPRDPDFPVVCLDETSKQLLAANGWKREREKAIFDHGGGCGFDAMAEGSV